MSQASLYAHFKQRRHDARGEQRRSVSRQKTFSLSSPVSRYRQRQLRHSAHFIERKGGAFAAFITTTFIRFQAEASFMAELNS